MSNKRRKRIRLYHRACRLWVQRYSEGQAYWPAYRFVRARAVAWP